MVVREGAGYHIRIAGQQFNERTHLRRPVQVANDAAHRGLSLGICQGHHRAEQHQQNIKTRYDLLHRAYTPSRAYRSPEIPEIVYLSGD